MDYNTFLKLTAALKKYIIEHPNNMCSTMRVQRHLLPDISDEDARYIAQNYRLYLRGEYSLDKLVILIILYKYGLNETFENCMGWITKPKYMTLRISWTIKPHHYVDAFEQFIYENIV